MKDEKYYYTKIGQLLLGMIEAPQWVYLVYKVSITNLGSINRNGYSIYNSKKTSLDFSPTELKELISSLIPFTRENNYTKWNKMEFRLNSDHTFSVDYKWDQEYYDELERSYDETRKEQELAKKRKG